MQTYQEVHSHHIANLPRQLAICHTTSPYPTIIIKLLFTLFPEKYSDIHHAKLTRNLISAAMYTCQRQRRYSSCHYNMVETPYKFMIITDLFSFLCRILTTVIVILTIQTYQEVDIHHIANLPRRLAICHTTSPYATIIIKLFFSLFPEKYSDIHHAKLTLNLISTTMYICPRPQTNPPFR